MMKEWMFGRSRGKKTVSLYTRQRVLALSSNRKWREEQLMRRMLNLGIFVATFHGLPNLPKSSIMAAKEPLKKPFGNPVLAHVAEPIKPIGCWAF